MKPSDFIQLKQKLVAELTRRGLADTVNAANSAPNPVSGQVISASHGKGVCDAFLVIEDFKDMTKAVSDGLVPQALKSELSKEIDRLAAEPNIQTYNNTQTSCRGNCVGFCTGNCFGGCNNTCTACEASCNGSCSGSCHNSCSGSCASSES